MIGYIINITDYSNTSIVIRVLTKEEGIITIFGKGYKKIKNRFYLMNNLFLKIKLVGQYSKKGNFYPSDVELLEDCTFKNDYLQYMQICRISTIISSLSPLLNNHFDLFEYTVKNNQINQNVILDLWLIAAYNNINVCEVSSCVSCANNNNIQTFDFNQGGYICSNCYNNEFMYSLSELRYIKALVNFDIDKLSNCKHYKNVTKNLVMFFTENQGYSLFEMEKYARDL